MCGNDIVLPGNPTKLQQCAKRHFTFLIHLDPPERAIPGGEYHQEEPHEPEESQHAIPGGKDEESQLLSEGNCTSVIF